jgi:hypothetical protein
VRKRSREWICVGSDSDRAVVKLFAHKWTGLVVTDGWEGSYIEAGSYFKKKFIKAGSCSFPVLLALLNDSIE